jgi:hypothetical protein
VACVFLLEVIAWKGRIEIEGRRNDGAGGRRGLDTLYFRKFEIGYATAGLEVNFTRALRERIWKEGIPHKGRNGQLGKALWCESCLLLNRATTYRGEVAHLKTIKQRENWVSCSFLPPSFWGKSSW